MYCSKRCTWNAKSRRLGKVPKAEYEAARRNAANWFICEHCGKDAHRVLSSTTNSPNRYCSMKCRSCAAAAKRPVQAAPEARQCMVCAKSFTPIKANRIRCSAACDLLHARVAAVERALAQHRAEAKCISCDECQALFSPLYGSSHATLCSPCADERLLAHKRTHKLKRHARQRGANAESVDPFKVFDRDRWRCQLCGVKTPRSKRGTCAPNAPELDHILPLSQRGDHTYLNTQCACRKCNGSKSNKPLGQLLLIG